MRLNVDAQFQSLELLQVLNHMPLWIFVVKEELTTLFNAQIQTHSLTHTHS